MLQTDQLQTPHGARSRASLLSNEFRVSPFPKYNLPIKVKTTFSTIVENICARAVVSRDIAIPKLNAEVLVITCQPCLLAHVVHVIGRSMLAMAASAQKKN